MVKQVRLMMFSLNMVDYSMFFLSLSLILRIKGLGTGLANFMNDECNIWYMKSQTELRMLRCRFCRICGSYIVQWTIYKIVTLFHIVQKFYIHSSYYTTPTKLGINHFKYWHPSFSTPFCNNLHMHICYLESYDEKKSCGSCMPFCLCHLIWIKKTRNRIPRIKTRISFCESEKDSWNLLLKVSLWTDTCISQYL